jgi:acetyltransferase-like isoleucine patch superfamily enzyme
MEQMEILIQFLAMLLPAALKRLVFRSLLGWSIGPGVKIGCSIFWGCDLVRIGRNTQIGHFNMFRNLKRLEIGDDALIINFNDFMAGKDHWPASLEIGNHSQVTSHHFFDCSGGIRIGNFSLIGGRDSQLWTHFYNWQSLVDKPLSIGDRCYICARSTLVYCHIPNDCVVGAGAVVTGDFSTQGAGLLLAGNPAVVKTKVTK